MESILEVVTVIGGIKTYERFNKNPSSIRCYQNIIDVFGTDISIGHLCKISNNIRLFNLLTKIPCSKFLKLKSALKSLKNDLEANMKILIQFTELDIYGIFTPESYTAFTQNVASNWEENQEGLTFHPKQIVLTGLPQKLVFICHGDDVIIEKIRVYVRCKYKSEIISVKTEDRTEITVNGVGGNNYDEMQKSCMELFQYINGSGPEGKKVANKIMPVLPEKIGKHNFITADLDYKIEHHYEIEEIIKTLKTLHGGNIVVNLLVVNGNINGAVNNGGIINNNNDNPAEGTLAWIRNNLPRHKEITTDYYNRYLQSYNGTKVPNNNYGNLVRSVGYTIVKGTNHRHWVEKKE